MIYLHSIFYEIFLPYFMNNVEVVQVITHKVSNPEYKNQLDRNIPID